MAEADSPAPERCRALTASGDRCSRPAGEDGFCYQHDERDQTVSESETQEPSGDDQETTENRRSAGEQLSKASADGEPPANETDDDPGGAESADAEAAESESESADADAAESESEPADAEAESADAGADAASQEGATDSAGADASDVDADEGVEAVLGVRRTVESTAGDLIGRPLSSVTEIQPTEDGWRGVVEVVERSSIPDTQDILGRYEIDLTGDGTVEGYRRLDRYRRDDTSNRELS